MKKVISVIIGYRAENEPAEPENIELMYTDEARSFAEILLSGIKQAKGKYTIITDNKLEFCDAAKLVEIAGGFNSDIIAFDGATAFKTSTLHNLTLDGDKDTAEISAALVSKSIENSDFKPFDYKPKQSTAEYSETVTNALIRALKEFKKCKAKLNKSVYNFVFEKICKKITEFYLTAILAVHKKQISADIITEFDAVLKENVVIYLSMDKRFDAANLNKLRKNNYKISFLTAKKFQKYLKKLN